MYFVFCKLYVAPSGDLKILIFEQYSQIGRGGNCICLGVMSHATLEIDKFVRQEGNTPLTLHPRDRGARSSSIVLTSWKAADPLLFVRCFLL